MLLAPLPLAAPSQEEALRSIGRSLDGTIDGARALAIVVGLLGFVALLVFLGLRSQRRAIAKPVNHYGKLLREVMRDTGLTAAELRQLRVLADQLQTPAGDAPGPLAMLLCPSLMTKAMANDPPRMDRTVLGELVGKMRE